jgi:molybdenum cofactor biosynthesis enzyme MoaA
MKKQSVINRDNSAPKLNSSLMKKMRSKYRISQLANYINNRYMKIPLQGYMTSQRLQALYNCEVVLP